MNYANYPFYTNSISLTKKSCDSQGSYVSDEEVNGKVPHIETTGACTVGYLQSIWSASEEKIAQKLEESNCSMVFAITGNNNKPCNTDEHLINVGFKEVFEAPNYLHNNVPVKLWAIDIKKWKEERATKKRPNPVAK